MQERVLRVALVQMEIDIQKSKNLAKVVSEIRSAKENGAQLVVLPENFNIRFTSIKVAEEIPSGVSSQTLSKAAAEYGVCIVGGSIIEEYQGKLYNTCTVWDHQGKRVATYRKIHLFNFDVPDKKIILHESDVLTAGENITTFEYLGAKIGLGICYDLCFPEMARIMANKGCHLLIFPADFEMKFGETYWELMGRARAADEQLWVAFVSAARDINHFFVSWGHTSIVNPDGVVVDKLDEKPGTLITDVDLRMVDEARKRLPLKGVRRTDLYDIVDKSNMYL